MKEERIYESKVLQELKEEVCRRRTLRSCFNFLKSHDEFVEDMTPQETPTGTSVVE